MWVKRTGGGLFEVVDGVETKRGEAFEVNAHDGAQLLKRPGFEKATEPAKAKAKRRAQAAEDATGAAEPPAPEDPLPSPKSMEEP